MVESTGLENRRGLTVHRGFESHPLRHRRLGRRPAPGLGGLCGGGLGQLRLQCVMTHAHRVSEGMGAVRRPLPAENSGHSLRAGFVTSAAVHHARLDKMMEVTRHGSAGTVPRYIRREDAFEDHAGAGSSETREGAETPLARARVGVGRDGVPAAASPDANRRGPVLFPKGLDNTLGGGVACAARRVQRGASVRPSASLERPSGTSG